MTTTPIKLIILFVLVYSFRELVHCHHDGKQAGLALEQYLRALHPDPQEKRGTGPGVDFRSFKVQSL